MTSMLVTTILQQRPKTLLLSVRHSSKSWLTLVPNVASAASDLTSSTGCGQNLPDALFA